MFMKTMFRCCKSADRKKTLPMNGDFSEEEQENHKIKEFLKVLKQYTIEFCENTTIHGFRHLVDATSHPIQKILWLLCIISMIVFSTYVCIIQWYRFCDPTVVSVKKDYRSWHIKYPAITVCLNEKSDPRLVDNFIEKTWNVTNQTNPERYEYLKYYVELVSTVSFRSNVREFWRYEKDKELVKLELTKIVEAVKSPVLIKTTLHNPNHPVKWVPVMTEMGHCQTFNSVFSAYQSFDTWKLRLTNPTAIAMTVKEQDLLSCSHIEGKCFARIEIINNTGNFYIHSPYEIAETTSNPTDVVEEGQEFQAQYRIIQIDADPKMKSLRIRQRKCKFSNEAISKLIPTYSNKLCHTECRIKMSIVFCGCRPFFYFLGEGKPCDLIGMSCIGRYNAILINLPINLEKCQCFPQCTEINYVQYNKRLLKLEKYEESSSDKRLSVKFSLQMPETLLTKGVIFTFEDLIASFGGAGGLFLGISFISVMELLLCLCRPCYWMTRNLKERISSRRNVNT